MLNTYFKIFLFGVPRVIAPDGNDVSPRSAKAKGLIALLCTPAGRIWSRSALQEKLWSDRGHTQGRDSLKKELSTLRAIFGDDEDGALVLNGLTVQLRGSHVRVDLSDPELRSEDQGPISPDFMAGCDIRDPAFATWLSDFRSKIDGPTLGQSRATLVEHRLDASPFRYKIALLPVIGPEDDLQSSMIGEMIADRIAITLRQLDLFDIVDFREPAVHGDHRGCDFTLRPRVLRFSTDLALSLVVHESADSKILWAEKRVVALARFGAEEVTCLVAEVLDQIITTILRKSRESDPERRLAARFALDGIDMMFRMDEPDIDTACATLRTAIDIDPRGPFLAFYAFQTLFRMEKSKGADLAELRERADELVARALEADPHNPITRSLATHVYSFLFRDFQRAESLIRPLQSSPPDSPIYYHALAALKLYTGKLDEARKAAVSAERMARFNVYSYAFSTTLAMVDTVGSRLDEAIQQGEKVVAMHNGTKRIYEPALRYLAAAYGLKGDGPNAARTLMKIRKQSPGFTAASLNDPTYPVPSEITRDVLRQGIGQAFTALESLKGT